MSFNKQTGNLNSRTDHVKQQKEDFTYDNLNRLTSATVTYLLSGATAPPHYITYDQNGINTQGNIAAKTDVGNYNYGSFPRHAVTYVDNSPQQISKWTQDITYTPFRKTEKVTETDNLSTANFEQTFTYDAAYQRVKSVLKQNGSLQQTRYYLDGYEYNTIGDEYIYYVPGGDGICAIVQHSPGAQTKDVHYVYTDHLGSILTVTDEQGNIEAEQNFDAWGRFRNTWNWADYTNISTQPSWLYRGYTGHEHMPEFSLINMNGRMYDPVLGRMMSPDPYIMGGTQGYNRYTYCLNNPLKYTDPTGEWVHIAIGALVGGVINLATNWNNIDNFWEGLAAFGVGAGSGAAVAATGGASLGVQLGVAAGTAAVTGATNNVVAQTGNGVGLNQVNWGQVGMSAGVGAVAGVAGYGAGQWAAGNLGTPLINQLGVNSPVVAGAINGAVGGAVGGAAGGFVAGGIMGGSLDAALQGAWNGFKSGGVVGGGAGAASGYFSALASGRNPWTGKYDQPVTPNDVQGISQRTTIEKDGSQFQIKPRTQGTSGDGSSSYMIMEMVNGNTISVTHMVVTPNGIIIHQHQYFIGTSGTQYFSPNNPNIGQFPYINLKKN